MSCSKDTNGDGNCGRPACPECGFMTEVTRTFIEDVEAVVDQLDDNPAPSFGDDSDK